MSVSRLAPQEQMQFVDKENNNSASTSSFDEALRGSGPMKMITPSPSSTGSPSSPDSQSLDIPKWLQAAQQAGVRVDSVEAGVVAVQGAVPKSQRPPRIRYSADHLRILDPGSFASTVIADCPRPNPPESVLTAALMVRDVLGLPHMMVPRLISQQPIAHAIAEETPEELGWGACAPTQDQVDRCFIDNMHILKLLDNQRVGLPEVQLPCYNCTLSVCCQKKNHANKNLGIGLDVHIYFYARTLIRHGIWSHAENRTIESLPGRNEIPCPCLASGPSSHGVRGLCNLAGSDFHELGLLKAMLQQVYDRTMEETLGIWGRHRDMLAYLDLQVHYGRLIDAGRLASC